MGQEVEKLIRTQQIVAYGAALYTIGLDGQRTLCMKWPGPFADVNELIEAVEERALRQANSLGGVHAFQIDLTDVKGESLGNEFFRVSAESFADGRSLVSEPANEGGVLALMMRHTEAMSRTLVQGSEKALASAHKLLDQANRRADFSEAKFLESLTALHGIMTGERETQVAMVKAEARAAATKQIASKIASLLPEVSAAFLSGNAGPKAGLHAAVVRVKSLFSSITSDQLQGILNQLNPEQQMGMFALMKHLGEEHEKEKALEAGGVTNGAKH